jgi:hypothetical protein
MKIDEDIGVDDEGDAPGSGCSAIGGHNRMHAILGTSDASPVRSSEKKWRSLLKRPTPKLIAIAARDERRWDFRGLSSAT